MSQENQAAEDTAIEQSEQVDAVIDEQPDTPDVVVQNKQFGGRLALVVALLSLAASGYLWYLNWQADKQAEGSVDVDAIQQQLNDADKVLSTQLKNIQVDVTNNTSKIQQLTQQAQQQMQSNSKPVPFDNQQNIAQIEALKQRLAEQDQQLKQLSLMLADLAALQPAEDQTRNYQAQTAIQQLLLAQTLLDNHQLTAVKNSLNNLMLDLSHWPSIANQVLVIKDQLNQLEEPDSNQLNQQLTDLNKQVNSLTLKVETKEATSSAWYEKFISVKKISNTGQLNSSADLAILKAHLNQSLINAKLALILQDQLNWQQQLVAAAQLLADQFSAENELVNQFKSLAEQRIQVKVPESVDLVGIVNQLREQR